MTSKFSCLFHRLESSINFYYCLLFSSIKKEYATSLAEQLGLRGPQTAKPLGENLNVDDLNKLRDEQVYQLYELMIAATGEDNKKKTT